MTAALNKPEVVLLFDDDETASDLKALVRRVCQSCLETEGAEGRIAVHLSLVSDEEIAAVNKEYRNNPSSTDVLSFPSCGFTPARTLKSSMDLIGTEYDPDIDACFLGDILISLPHAEKQAAEYGHSFQREVAYLTVHAMFHLMGYDHMNKEDKTVMRSQEEKSLEKAGLVSDDKLLEKAREAMRFSYSPYSHYRVGACLRCCDGSVYTGCNIENSSYGASNCAERTAIFKAVSEGRRQFDAIAIASDEFAPWPCGICRQVMYEFSPDMRVLVTWGDHTEEASLKDLLVNGFGPAGSAADFLGR